MAQDAFRSQMHYDLLEWGDWGRTNHIGAGNVLARMMQQRMEDVSTSTAPDGFPLHIEVVDKSMAKLKRSNRPQYRLLMDYYLGRVDHHELAQRFYVDPELVKRRHAEAINALSSIAFTVRKELTENT